MSSPVKVAEPLPGSPEVTQQPVTQLPADRPESMKKPDQGKEPEVDKEDTSAKAADKNEESLPLQPDESPNEPATISPSDPTLPDSTVTALISSLRASLASSQSLLSSQAQRLTHLSDLEDQHRQLKDSFAFLSAAKEAVEASLREEVKKREEAEERVEALRGQVEMARRGVMTLQKQEKERKRMSMMGAPPGGLGLNMGIGMGEEVLDVKEEKEEKLNRRTSVLGGRTHRRVSSQSEPDIQLAHLVPPPSAGAASSGSALSTSPSLTSGPSIARIGGLRELRLGAGTTPTATGPSPQLPSPMAFDDPYTPSGARTSLSPPASGPGNTSPSRALNAARADAERLRTELAATTLRLAESEEARQASETVLKALREFIGGGSGGAGEGGTIDLNDPMTMEELKGISLPPLPTDRDVDEPPSANQDKDQSRKAGAGGWGFKLWAGSTTTTKPVPPTPGSPGASSQIVEPPATPHVFSPPPSIRSNSTPRASPLPGTAQLPLDETAINTIPAQQTPLASFVSSWTKSIPPGTPAPPNATTGTPQPPAAVRSFSSFFRKGTPAAATQGKEKELPGKPVAMSMSREGSEVGSIGAERVDHMDQSKLPGVQAEGKGLEPSPVIKDAAEENVDFAKREEVSGEEAEPDSDRVELKEEKDGDKV